MALFPNTRCPNCNGPVTFFEVMSIVTPFQGIDCSTCGELVFLKHKMELFLISIGLGLVVFFGALFSLTSGKMSILLTYSVGIILLVVTEFLITTYVIIKKDLVVRRHK
jgi:hypothetical protein